MSGKTETLALVGVILGGLSLLSAIVLIVLVFLMRNRISTMAKTFSASQNRFGGDGKLRDEALPASFHQELSQMSSKVQDAERGCKRSEDSLKDLKQQLQALLERVTKVENTSSMRQLPVPRDVSHFEHMDESATKSEVATRMPASAQPLQRFVGSATKPANGPSPASPGSQSSNDSDPLSPNSDKQTDAVEGISYSARPRQGSEQQDDVTVKADIGFGQSSSGYQPALLDHQHQTLWSPPTDKSHFQNVPLLPARNKQHGEGSTGGLNAAYDELAPVLAPLPATPTLAGKLANVDHLKSSPGYSATSNSPGNSSSRNRRGNYSNHSAPLSARGINPEKHPELHAKEMAEMVRLVQVHCSDSASVVSRTAVKCLWCHQSFACPPYRPQSFFFKDLHNNGEHDGHFWSCAANPNNSLQAGRGVNVGDGKVLI